MFAYGSTSSTLLDALQDRQNQEAWSVFCDRYRPQIVGWCKRLGANDHDAEDASQVALAKLVEKLERYDRSKGRFRDWLQRVSINAWKDLLRERKRQLIPNWELLSDEFSEVVVRLFDEEVFGQACETVRRQVKADNWNVFSLVVLQEHDAASIAEQTGRTRASIYQAAFRIRQLLKTEIERIEGSTG